MKKYIIYNIAGKILRTGVCSDTSFGLKAKMGEFIMRGTADDVTQKIINDKVVNKTPKEIEAEKPPSPVLVPFEQQRANITNEQWQNTLNRIIKLER